MHAATPDEHIENPQVAPIPTVLHRRAIMNEKTVRQGRHIAWIIILAAVGLYAVFQVRFLIDPWSSWIHPETASSDAVLRFYFETPNSWESYLTVITTGTGTDTNPARLRLFNNAVEFFDAYWRRPLVAEFGFLPALTNASTLIYFLLCPLFAVVVARQLIGRSIFGAIAIVLAVNAFLTSVGFESASIFVFHPGKKIVIFLSLLQLTVFLRYIRRPHIALVALVGACQFALGLTDEIGLVSGLVFSCAAAGYAFLVTGRYLLEVALLAAFGVATAMAYGYNYATHWNEVFVHKLPVLDRTFGQLLLSMWPSSGLDLAVAHVAGAFSLLYGSRIAGLLLAFSVATTCVLAAVALVAQRSPDEVLADTRGGFGRVASSYTFLTALVFLVVNSVSAVMLLRFGGSLSLSEYNYYYASNLSVFALLITCSTFRVTNLAAQSKQVISKLAGRAAQLSLAVALALAIAANVQEMPRVNEAFGLLHSNPFLYGVINRLAQDRLHSTSSATERQVLDIPRCSKDAMTARFDALLDQLNASSRIRNDLLYLTTQLSQDDRYIHAVMAMMLRKPPPIDVVVAPAGQC